MVYLIASHNTRIQCLINLIKTLEGDQIRFKNCCVIRIEIDASKNVITVELVFSGVLGNEEKDNIYKKSYYVSLKDLVVPVRTRDGSFEPEYTRKSKITGMKFWSRAPEEPKVSKEQSLDFIITKSSMPNFDEVLENLKPFGSDENPLATGKHIFYIVRHGQALHNVKKPNIYLDTSLTAEGQNQAKLAGEALYEIMKERNEPPDVLLVSDLKRTHQTLNTIIDNMIQKAEIDPTEYAKNIKRLREAPFVVLPCASELSEAAKDGKCDLATAMTSKMDVFSGKYAPENFPSCTKNSNGFEMVEECKKIHLHPLIWSYYLWFYGNEMRVKFLGSRTKDAVIQHCRDTNMLANIFKYMKNYGGYVNAPSVYMDAPLYTPLRGGKVTRKKRKTKRLRNSNIKR